MIVFDVNTVSELTSAIKQANPGDYIRLAPGDYKAPAFNSTSGGGVVIQSADPSDRARLIDSRIDNIDGFAFISLDIVADKSSAFYAPNVDGVAFMACHFYSLGGAASGRLGLDLRTSNFLSFIGTRFTDLANGMKLFQCNDITVQGCEFADLGADACQMNTCDRVLVSRNHFHRFAMVAGSHPDAFQIDTNGATRPSRYVIVADNLFEEDGGTKFQGVFLSDPGGQGVEDFIIVRNRVIGALGNGIYPSAGSGVINDNYVAGTDSDSWIKWNGQYEATGNTCQKGSKPDPTTNTILQTRPSQAELQAQIDAWRQYA
jgi:Right handed beta helix region